MKFLQSNNITLICLCDKFQLWKALKMVGLQGSIPYMGTVWSLCQSEESMTLSQFSYKSFRHLDILPASQSIPVLLHHKVLGGRRIIFRLMVCGLSRAHRIVRILLVGNLGI